MALSLPKLNRKIIAVTGSHSGCGKTILAEHILSLCQGFAAIKISITSLKTLVTDNDKAIMQPGKDTFRLKISGAEKVVWVRTSRGNLQKAVQTALLLTNAYKKILIEGNSILNYLDPDLCIFVFARQHKPLKSSGLNALKKADIIVINAYQDKLNLSLTEKYCTELNPNARVKALNLEDRVTVLLFLKTILKNF